MARNFLPMLTILCLGSACSSKAGPSLAGGTVALRLTERPSAELVLPSGTNLASSGAATDGKVVGHCRIDGGTTDVSVERTAISADAADAGVPSVAWFRLRLDSPEAPQIGRVYADVDGELYEADCEITVFSRSRDDQSVDLTISGCELMTPTPSGGAASLDADLRFSGCSVR